MELIELGWKAFFQEQIEEQEQSLLPARVYRQDVNCYHLFSTIGDLTGTLPGRLFTEAASKAELPTVGDWVLTSPADDQDPRSVIIEKTLNRRSKFSRKQAGDKVEEQGFAGFAWGFCILIIEGLMGRAQFADFAAICQVAIPAKIPASFCRHH